MLYIWEIKTDEIQTVYSTLDRKQLFNARIPNYFPVGGGGMDIWALSMPGAYFR